MDSFRLHRKNEHLRWACVFLERTRILSEIQFTRHFIEFVIVETKRFVGSNVNVILTRQTCGQRLSTVAESNRWALEKHFSERICYIFLISKYRGYWNLGLCTLCVLAKREPLRNGDFRTNLVSPAEIFRICHCAAVLFSQVTKKCTDLDVSLFNILISGTYGRFARKHNFLALGVCFPQTCSSAGSRFVASTWRWRLQYCWRIVSFPQPNFL